ncbi:MAG TPA: AbrB/MazE/SpoVT family DNA-binding domain-containing protein [Aequorivita sp.]|jgi:antitoxin MazE|nr:AbrB/MazE/SpoVT family DNA-binding domain-containing protein [Aequorivita sp.]MBF29927.1 AbrB/MazE/SpoVT family DNA-binding domain-containing protein [Aequorivita sp.]HAV55616.1 AbrB/MazE/SpoVT family DNA-binding domain-containing protein [Aequorivita sp.]HBL79091.1 AbrB/MazE/SpoVT family DNA-binding domain-containing protein [Aequorivita sp.]|tara:strand:+ start:113436 stop:113690 length:255 start_codon:yes stop_codon:yes gene_type:complete
MEAKIIKVGNSKGIIIPAKFLKLIGLEEKVAIEIEDDKMIITAAKSKPREGWEEMLAEDVAKYGQPEKLMPDFFEEENNTDWEW